VVSSQMKTSGHILISLDSHMYSLMTMFRNSWINRYIWTNNMHTCWRTPWWKTYYERHQDVSSIYLRCPIYGISFVRLNIAACSWDVYWHYYGKTNTTLKLGSHKGCFDLVMKHDTSTKIWFDPLHGEIFMLTRAGNITYCREETSSYSKKRW
jgi:hypothetical protein